jgi:uncharacterized RDD family membrane protein YckC
MKSKKQEPKHSLFTETGSTFVKLKDAVTTHIVMKDFWLKRVNAVVIDYLLLFFVTGILLPAAYLVEFVLAMGLLSLLYFGITESIFGYTLGKKLFALKVVNLDGTKPSLKDSFTRNLSKFNVVFLILDTVIGRITSSTHQKFLDRIANTTVDDLSTLSTLSETTL